MQGPNSGLWISEPNQSRTGKSQGCQDTNSCPQRTKAPSCTPVHAKLLHFVSSAEAQMPCGCQRWSPMTWPLALLCHLWVPQENSKRRKMTPKLLFITPAPLDSYPTPSESPLRTPPAKYKKPNSLPWHLRSSLIWPKSSTESCYTKHSPLSQEWTGDAPLSLRHLQKPCFAPPPTIP